MRTHPMHLIAALALSAALVSCSALQTATTPSQPQETAVETRVVIDADAAYITAADALSSAEDHGLITGANRVRGEQLRQQAHAGLLVIRAAVDARRRPDMTTFSNAIGQLNALVASVHHPAS